jgi:hypothetical protein
MEDMSEKRDLEYYMAHPHEMPSNMDDLLALEGGDEGGLDVPPLKEGETSATPGASGGEKVAESGAASGDPAGGAANKAGTEPPQVVKSRDGKHEIPYQVLETERERRQAAEQAAETLRQQLADLQAQATGKTAAPAPAAAVAQPDTPSEADIDQIAADFPEQGKVLKALLGTVTALQQELGSLRQNDAARSTRDATTAQGTVQQAIDGNEKLRYLQAKDPELFAEAIRLDNQLKASPRTKGLTLTERFTSVVAGLEATFGEIDVPAEFKTSPAPTPTPTPAPKVAQKTDVAAQAKAAVEAAERAQRIQSLSDIPGGTPPAATELEALGNLSVQELGVRLQEMDPAKLTALLARAA